MKLKSSVKPSLTLLKYLPDNCPYKCIYGDVDIWHKLNDNKWIFVQTKPTKLFIECVNNVTNVVISGTGVLSVPLRCVAFHKNVKLVTKIYPSTNVHISI